jgi:mRNA interferase RelE/StbE
MSYKVDLEQNAADELEKLNEAIIQRIILRINWLATNYENIKPKPLTGTLKGYFKFRIGHYRAIYTVNHQEKAISIVHIGHRRDIYKRQK